MSANEIFLKEILYCIVATTIYSLIVGYFSAGFLFGWSVGRLMIWYLFDK